MVYGDAREGSVEETTIHQFRILLFGEEYNALPATAMATLKTEDSVLPVIISERCALAIVGVGSGDSCVESETYVGRDEVGDAGDRWDCPCDECSGKCDCAVVNSITEVSSGGVKGAGTKLCCGLGAVSI